MGRKAIYYQQHPLQTEIIFMTLFLTICISEHRTCLVFFSPHWPWGKTRAHQFSVNCEPHAESDLSLGSQSCLFGGLWNKNHQSDRVALSRNLSHESSKLQETGVTVSEKQKDTGFPSLGWYLLAKTSPANHTTKVTEANKKAPGSGNMIGGSSEQELSCIEEHLPLGWNFSEHRMHQDSMSQPPLQLRETVWLISGHWDMSRSNPCLVTDIDLEEISMGSHELPSFPLSGAQAGFWGLKLGMIL